MLLHGLGRAIGTGQGFACRGREATLKAHLREYTLRPQKNMAINVTMVSKSGAALSPSPQRPSRGARVIQLPGAEADLALVRGFARELRIACDDLHGDPFDTNARAHLVRLILQGSDDADAANQRLHRTRASADC